MREIKLVVTRDKSFVAAAMPYRIALNGAEESKITVGKTVQLTINDEPTTMKISMLGNMMTFHGIKKEVVLHPQYCKKGVIKCSVVTRPNWVGILTMGIFQPVGRVEVSVEYE